MSRGFRILDKVNKKYIDFSFATFLPSGELVGITTKNGRAPVLAENYTVEQYTGLKDKNGKEIYEGDIVLDYYDGDDAFIVEWDKDTASFILTGTDNIASVSFDNFYSDKDLEVIGNIHENPELLGGEE